MKKAEFLWLFVHSSALRTNLDRRRRRVNLSIKSYTVHSVLQADLGFGLQQLAIGRNIPYIYTWKLQKYILFIADFFF